MKHSDNRHFHYALLAAFIGMGAVMFVYSLKAGRAGYRDMQIMFCFGAGAFFAFAGQIIYLIRGK